MFKKLIVCFSLVLLTFVFIFPIKVFAEESIFLDLSVEDERVNRYLKGETLDVGDLVNGKAKGWYLVCVDGYSLGWGKLANGTLKNKYLPGWRLNS